MMSSDQFLVQKNFYNVGTLFLPRPYIAVVV